MEPSRPSRSLDADTLDFMFPCYLAVNSDLRIMALGSGLQRLAPEAGHGTALLETFQFERPFEISLFAQLAMLRNSQVVLAVRRDERLRLRGVIASQPDGSILLLLSPLILDGRAAEDLGINFTNLSPCDGSAELVMANEMQRIMTIEARELAERLADARDEAVAKQAFFDTVIKLLPTMVTVRDARDGRYLLVNAAAEEVLGISAEEALGRNLFDLFPAAEAEKFAADDAEVIASGDMKVELGVAITTRSLGQRYFVTKKLATHDKAGALYVVTVGEDVTERHEAEDRNEQLRTQLTHVWRMNSLGEMAAMLAHELNQPLTAISNYVNGARAIVTRIELADDDLVDALDKAGAQAVRAGDIIRRTRAMLARDAGALKRESLRSVIDEIEPMLALVAREAAVTMRYDFAPGPDKVLMDRIQIQQVVSNLVRNAVDAVRSSTERIVQVSTERREAEWIVRVQDSGLGVKANMIDQLFTPMASTKPQGMGLGLSISRTIVEHHKGVLWMENSTLGGATFCFTLQR